MMAPQIILLSWLAIAVWLGFCFVLYALLQYVMWKCEQREEDRRRLKERNHA